MNEEDRRQAILRRQKQVEAHKAKMMPLIRFLKKRGLKFKNANFDNMRVEYFRLDMLREILETNQAEIANSPQLTELVELMKADLIYFSRPKNQEKRKYPQYLTLTEEGKKPKFASFKFDTTESKRWMLITFIVIVFAGVMFPLWPYELKYGAWLVSFTLLMVLLGIIFARLILYLILAIFGISFWVFPNLFGDKGIIDSFKPFYSVEKWDKDIFSIIGRLIAFSVFMYYSYSIYNDPQFYLENIESTKKAMGEIHDWGVGKIKGDAGNFSQRALSMEKIINDTADAYEEATLQTDDQPQAQTDDQPQAQTEEAL